MLVLLLGVTSAVMLHALTKRCTSERRRPTTEEETFEAKLTSIARGERRGVEALVQIASSRATPDRPRARAIRMLSERADTTMVGRVLEVASHGCGRETCIEIFRQAATFPNREKLERVALDVFEGSSDADLRMASLDCLAAIGRLGCLGPLRRIVRRSGSSELRAAAARAVSTIRARHPDADQLEGALSVPGPGHGSVSVKGL